MLKVRATREAINGGATKPEKARFDFSAPSVYTGTLSLRRCSSVKPQLRSIANDWIKDRVMPCGQ